MKTKRRTSYDVAVEMYRNIKGVKLNTARILEPSAGSGDLIQNFIIHLEEIYGYKLVNQNNFYCIELNHEKRKQLLDKGYRVVGANFLEYENTDEPFDLVLACPPFKNGIDTTHIIKMYDLVKEGGMVVTLTQPRWLFNNVKEAREFREFLVDKEYSLKILPDNSFIEKGKTVPTAILSITKL